MKPSCFILFFTLILQGCTSQVWNQNDDNTIYIPGRTFYFLASYYDSSGALKKRHPVALSVTDGYYPQRSQTQIIWKFTEIIDGDTAFFENKTGVIDSPEEGFFIHQPRIRDMEILKFADFPTFSPSVFKDSTGVVSSEGTVKMFKTYKGIIVNEVKTSQVYQGKTTLSLQEFGNRRVYYNKAEAISPVGTISGDYYFDEILGFVKLVFNLPDQEQIELILVGKDF